jgi:hypothetical protein
MIRCVPDLISQSVRRLHAGALAVAVAVAAAAAVALTGCGSGGAYSGGKATSTPCKSLVGKPLSKAWDSSAETITCTDSGTGQVPPAWQSSGCYPGGKYDKQTPMISFSADDGFYFGRTGDALHFKAGAPSMSAMSKIVGC